MTQIIIAAPAYNESIGGVVVLHKLCHILNELGYNSSLTTTLKLNGQNEYFLLNSNYNTKITTEIDLEKDIIIYPEIQPGNPLGGKNIIRWILNDYHLPEKDNIVHTWDDRDLWLYYSEEFYDNLKEKNILFIRETKLDIFKNYNLKRDIESCFTYRKNHHLKTSLPIHHPTDSIEIPHIISDEELVNIFNRSKRFYSYDTETYLNELASLCGCESIVIPNPLSKTSNNRLGVAYGLENLEYAKSTQNQLIEKLKQDEINNSIHAKIIFEEAFKYFNIKK